MRKYELHDYSDEAAEPVVTHIDVSSDTAARARAGRLAKNNGGPVDLAYAGPGGRASWPQRYITTAGQSEHHASGYYFERLES